MAFLSLKDLLPKAIRSAGIAEQVQAARILDASQAIIRQLLPPVVSRQVTPLRISHGVLVLQVASSAIAQELRFRENAILRQLGEQFPGRVERLRYQMAGQDDYES
ncbi:MAG: DUF721 domain-containing protein [Patescibacteria group bacterium]|nr:DUF721 domain-containing protein [Patescibacteria group bacterium]